MHVHTCMYGNQSQHRTCPKMCTILSHKCCMWAGIFCFMCPNPPTTNFDPHTMMYRYTCMYGNQSQHRTCPKMCTILSHKFCMWAGIFCYLSAPICPLLLVITWEWCMYMHAWKPKCPKMCTILSHKLFYVGRHILLRVCPSLPTTSCDHLIMMHVHTCRYGNQRQHRTHTCTQ